MTARIKTIYGEAICEDYHWQCDDKVIEDYLNSLLKPMGPGGEDPDPDLNAAEQAIQALPGSELIDHAPIIYDESVVY
jgi:hypothetical protein